MLWAEEAKDASVVKGVGNRSQPFTGSVMSTTLQLVDPVGWLPLRQVRGKGWQKLGQDGVHNHPLYD